MAVRSESSGYGAERNSSQRSNEGPFFMEPHDQISLWREREQSIINPAILETVQEATITGLTSPIDEQATL